MAHLRTFTDERIRELRQQADKSFLFFSRALWGNTDIDPDVHGELCRILQYVEWKRLLVCAARGLLKSSIVHSWVVWKGLTVQDWSAILIEQREANARAHHEKIQARFRSGRYAGLLREIYKDRLTDGLDGWTTGPNGRTIFVRDNPDADPFLTHAGIDSKLESAHKDCIVVDDPEGADADKSDAPNIEARKLVEERAEPLLKSPGEGQIAVVGTPHGSDPLVWHIRDLAEQQRKDAPGNPLNWHVFWQPATKNGQEDGELVWPARQSPEWWASTLSKAKISSGARRMIDMQYLLRRGTVGSATLDYQQVLDTAFSRAGSGAVVRYETTRYLKPSPANEFQYQSYQEAAHANLAYCNRYLHMDPLHKDPADRKGKEPRPSRWAIVATAVAHDLHVFVAESWIEDTTFDAALDKLFQMYRYWQPKLVTYESVGAQAWLKNHVRMLERSRYNRGILSLPSSWSKMSARLPALTSRLQESHKGTREKEGWIVENLELPINMGHLHFDKNQETILEEVRLLGSDPHHPIDGLDALSQGPGVWESPPSPEKRIKMRWQQYVDGINRVVEPLTGYQRPWS